MEMKKRYKLLLNSAKSRKIEINLNTQYYSDLIEMGCLYCGDTLINKKGTCLDRQDSNKGYTNENVVGCCHICNFAKRTLSDRDFYSWVRKAYDHQLKCHTHAIINAIDHNYKEAKHNKKNFNVYMNSKKVRNAFCIVYNPSNN